MDTDVHGAAHIWLCPALPHRDTDCQEQRDTRGLLTRPHAPRSHRHRALLSGPVSAEGTGSPSSSRGIAPSRAGLPGRAHRVSASCYFGMFMPQKVLLNTAKINKPSRPKAAEITFCGLVAPDFISSLRSKARLLQLTFPCLFQTREQAILHLTAHRAALQGAASDFSGNQELSPLLVTSVSLS